MTRLAAAAVAALILLACGPSRAGEPTCHDTERFIAGARLAEPEIVFQPLQAEIADEIVRRIEARIGAGRLARDTILVSRVPGERNKVVIGLDAAGCVQWVDLITGGLWRQIVAAAMRGRT